MSSPEPDQRRRADPGIYAGVDWGTHSSKWAYFPSESAVVPVVGPIRSSNLLRTGESLLFDPTRMGPGAGRVVRSIKRLILGDPGGAFWEGERDDTHTSTGDAVAFSLCNLLTDLNRAFLERGIQLDPTGLVDIGFSLPNWVEEDDEEQKAALTHFHQAVMVALDIWVHVDLGELPTPEVAYPIARWREMVRDTGAKRRTQEPSEWASEGGGISVESLVRKDTYDVGFIRSSYLVESCAAGLPYLRAPGDPRTAESPKMRKILVVDVGAGSTDIGYMVRSIVEGRWYLHYFTPGSTHGFAGDELTRRIQAYLRQQSRMIGFDEAQTEKEIGTGRDWQVTKDWIRVIARHVGEYIETVPDGVRLPQDPPLEIVLTGGSGPSIAGLGDAIRIEVRDALQRRGIGAVAERTAIADVVLPEYGLPDAIAYARRIVSLGAADRDKPKLRHIERLEQAGAGGVRIVTWRGSGDD